MRAKCNMGRVWLRPVHAPLTMSITSPSAAARKSLTEVISAVTVP